MRLWSGLSAAIIVVQMLVGCETANKPPPQAQQVGVIEPTASQISTSVVSAVDTTAPDPNGTVRLTTNDATTGHQCAGDFRASDPGPVLTAPVTCSDGRTGVMSIAVTPDQRGAEGTIVLSDGAIAQVSFGVTPKDAAVEPVPSYQPPFAEPAPVYQSPPVVPRYGCAENGSCYGDISELTGNPKTVHVGGYYRRDGTYVRGHYRSKPRY